MISKVVSEQVRKRFQNRDPLQLPTYIKGQIMKRVKVEFSSNSIVLKNTEFQVLQGIAYWLRILYQVKFRMCSSATMM